MYTSTNFKSKKAFKDAVAAGNKISVYQPGLGPAAIPNQKGIAISGPHYPSPHTWYAQVDLDADCYVSKVR